jgi:hypothetical protein
MAKANESQMMELTQLLADRFLTYICLYVYVYAVILMLRVFVTVEMEMFMTTLPKDTVISH